MADPLGSAEQARQLVEEARSGRTRPRPVRRLADALEASLAREDTLREALRRIENAPYSVMDNPETELHVMRDIARAALSK